MTQQQGTTPDSSHRTVCIDLDRPAFDDLSRVAGERGVQPAELVERWVRERLAHERERSLGRERPQRPQRD